MTPSPPSLWSPISGGITSPLGYRAAGIKSGLKSSGKLDLALLLAPKDAICAGTFTQSSIRAACVDICQQKLKECAGKVRAVLINSGQANACIGKQAFIDSYRAINDLSDHLGLPTSQVLMCSTGVIGEAIPMQKLLNGLEKLVSSLDDSGGNNAAQAILTTDLVDKQIAYESFVDGRRVRIGGMAKGSGMIHPNMATMLAYLTCDVGVSFDLWSTMIQRVVNSSFNAISVDGDTSTNDSFLAFSSGEPVADKFLEHIEMGLLKTSQHLAKAIARDGEGANSLLEIKVEGCKTSEDARLIARTIISSSLVKTAINGHDPNWGRIVAATGRAGVPLSSDEIDLWIGSFQLVSRGEPILFDRSKVSEYMKEKFNDNYLQNNSITIRLKVGKGKGEAVAWGCDLSEEYIRINADYTT
ncbi:bifunctional glutamate N-acetyltransferase/amino-acid acetyltransferase ArgJ [Prochlorococcus sp. MIT 1223]|uniref:bifunctional glutamate N-acetyltransferase/amino-acid acetyltransferase ArgJ n=1 Tax=Prochlorococcus sp. MIT 1223 TaxID=3096217 RepID=UPI0039C0B290